MKSWAIPHHSLAPSNPTSPDLAGCRKPARSMDHKSSPRALVSGVPELIGGGTSRGGSR
jgi:hypothetical protein